MSHLLDRMIYAGETPWHGLGTKLDSVPTFEQMRDVFCQVRERPVLWTGETADVPTTDYKAIVRTDTDKLLSIMPKTYGVVQYADACEVLNAAAQDGIARFITAGMLDEGRRAWALATIPSAEFDVAGSAVKPYLLMSTSHDGSLAVRYHFTGVYVVCNNTLTAALDAVGVQVGQEAHTHHIPNVITLKHTSRVNDRLAIARRLIEQARLYFGAFNEQALILVNERFSTMDMEELTKVLFPITDEQEARYKKDGRLSSSHEAQAKVGYLFRGAQRAANNAPGTKWAAFNAITEFLDHWRKPRGQNETEVAESRFDSTMFGQGSKVRQTALNLLRGWRTR